MRIAVIGGGATGMTTAYYLAAEHEVVVFEKQPRAGGNIKTLGKNTEAVSLPSDIIIDNGVIEFLADLSPHLTRLLAELGIETEVIAGGSTGLFLPNGQYFHMPGPVARDPQFWRRNFTRLRLLSLVPGFASVFLRPRRNPEKNDLKSILGSGAASNWLRMLMMYSYSIPYSQIDQFPLDLALTTLNQLGPGTSWMRIVGGVYSYIEAILEKREISLITDADVSIRRGNNQVHLQHGGQERSFDRVVIATPPHAVLNLLSDPSERETALFREWQPNYAETVIHMDASIYDQWAPPEYTEFDVFEHPGGRDAGYNAYLNLLSGLSAAGPEHYFLAYNLGHLVDPGKIIHRHTHETPLYVAGNSRHDIARHSGTNQTYYAGAYLTDGLHEGAIESAVHVAGQIN